RISSNNLLTPAKVQISNDVLTLGLGNRWQFKSGITFGIEWLDLVLAMGQGRIEENFMDRVNDKDEQDDLQTLFDYFRHGTTFQILKVTLGYSF
ncbi:MAG: hypothetical protein M3Q07_06665, partial [Pseudobdellovibrionaceae bacterium]|nr:hypothetical protein [Pseudobdellovibrionaceae bacterium]